MASQDDTAVEIITQLNGLVADLSSGNDPVPRRNAINLARQLAMTLEHPKTVATELMFSPFLAISARIAVQLNLFRYILDSNGPITSDTLASLSGGEELLIIRVLRGMAAIGFVKEVGQQTWEATLITREMAKEEIAAGHRAMGEMLVGPGMYAPKFLREAGYRCPTDPHDGLVQYAFQTKHTVFGLLETMPAMFKDFNTFMGHVFGARKYWVDWYPVQERLINGAADGSALLVDVAGGRGHDTQAFHDKYPNAGRLILQDVAAVTEIVDGLDPAIEVMAYDFFTEQRVKGARAYFYHHIFHDWSDEQCLKLLCRVKAAMTPGYSKLLIHDMVVPEQGATSFHATFDLSLMAFNSGLERTARQWEQLISRAGLKVIKIWLPKEEDADGIVEVILE